jgi:hypothetical protein
MRRKHIIIPAIALTVRKNYASIGIAILITWMIILWINQHIKTWYLPDPLKNATLVDSCDVADIYGAQLFKLDKSTSGAIIKHGIYYLNNYPSSWYVNWRKTPVGKITALRGFACNGNFDKYTIELIYKEIKSDRGYYTVAENKVSAIFVFPELSIVALVYYET